MLKTIGARLNRLTSCERGNVSMIMALCAVPTLMVAGSAIDYGRYTNTHQDVAVALDAGLLAAAASLYNDEDLTAEDIAAAKIVGKNYFKEALGLQPGAVINDPTFTYDEDAEELKATVTGDVNTNFLVVTGLTDLELKVEAVAKVGHEELIGSNLEVAMMLDVTGSMCDIVDGSHNQPCTTSDSMTALKTAAKDLIKEVVWEDQSKYTSKVSIVPFSSRVRLAEDGQAGSLFTAVTGMPSTWSGYTTETNSEWQAVVPAVTKKKDCEKLSGAKWKDNQCKVKITTQSYTHHQNLKVKPCVTERFIRSTSTLGLTEEAPSFTRFNNGNDGSRFPISHDSAGTTVVKDGSTQALALTDIPSNYSTDGVCDDGSIGNTNTLVPLTNNKTVLENRINELVAENGTAGVLGTSFAWYTISPEWAGVWGGSSAPEPYSRISELNDAGKQKLFKIAVLMTDGEYNTAIADTSNPSVATLNANALSLCTAMKAKKIEIYTVGFKLPSTSDAKTMLQSCATDAAHFKDASSSADLKAAFKEIGKRIKSQAEMEIRLTQ